MTSFSFLDTPEKWGAFATQLLQLVTDHTMQRNPKQRPSDHGGDGGYEHRCRECNRSFHDLSFFHDIEKVPEGENKDGDICEDCYEPTAETE